MYYNHEFIDNLTSILYIAGTAKDIDHHNCQLLSLFFNH